MDEKKHILTGSNLTGYSCSLCKQSWGKGFTLGEIEAMLCEGHKEWHIVHHTRIDRRIFDNLLSLPKHPQMPHYLETPQERKGNALLKRWIDDETGQG